MTSEHTRAIHPDEVGQCIELWHCTWPNAAPGYFERYLRGDAEFIPEYCRVSSVDGQVVASAMIVRRTVSCGDMTLTVGCLANVATVADYRGRGYANECVQQCLKVMEADTFDLSILFSDRHHFYGRLGYTACPMTHFEGPPREEVCVKSDTYLVRKASVSDFAPIEAIYARYNLGRPLAVVRSSAYWREWIRWDGGGFTSQALVAAAGDEVIGYAVARRREDCADIVELCTLPGHEEAMRTLCCTISTGCAGDGVARLSLHLPGGYPLPSIAEKCLGSVQAGCDTSLMVRLLNSDALLRGIAPELTDRWRRAGSPAGQLAVSTPYGPAALTVSDTSLQVRAMVPEETPAMIGQSDLVSLLMGYDSCSYRLDPETRMFIQALFPTARGWFWALDRC